MIVILLVEVLPINNQIQTTFENVYFTEYIYPFEVYGHFNSADDHILYACCLIVPVLLS